MKFRLLWLRKDDFVLDIACYVRHLITYYIILYNMDFLRYVCRVRFQ